VATPSTSLGTTTTPDVATPSTSPATTENTSVQSTQVVTTKRHSSWGWLGLFGLIGLVNLFRRKSQETVY
ncbi:MAG: WGxxGxxG family protein, partial [Coleofasciculaceae cyanobacterium]